MPVEAAYMAHKCCFWDNVLFVLPVPPEEDLHQTLIFLSYFLHTLQSFILLRRRLPQHRLSAGIICMRLQRQFHRTSCLGGGWGDILNGDTQQGSRCCVWLVGVSTATPIPDTELPFLSKGTVYFYPIPAGWQRTGIAHRNRWQKETTRQPGVPQTQREESSGRVGDPRAHQLGCAPPRKQQIRTVLSVYTEGAAQAD